MLRIAVISLFVANLLLLGFQRSKPAAPPETIAKRTVTEDSGVPTIHLFSEMVEDQDLMSDNRHCFSLGPFHSAEDKNQTRALLEEVSANIGERETLALVEKGYWVFMPPYESLLEANQVLLSLQALGLKDIGVVYSGDWKNAVSLGYFLRQENALKRKKGLEDRDFSPAIRVQRQSEPRYWLDYELEPGSALIALDMQNRPNDFMQRSLPCADQDPVTARVSETLAAEAKQPQTQLPEEEPQSPPENVVEQEPEDSSEPQTSTAEEEPQSRPEEIIEPEPEEISEPQTSIAEEESQSRPEEIIEPEQEKITEPQTLTAEEEPQSPPEEIIEPEPEEISEPQTPTAEEEPQSPPEEIIKPEQEKITEPQTLTAEEEPQSPQEEIIEQEPIEISEPSPVEGDTPQQKDGDDSQPTEETGLEFEEPEENMDNAAVDSEKEVPEPAIETEPENSVGTGPVIGFGTAPEDSDEVEPEDSDETVPDGG